MEDEISRWRIAYDTVSALVTLDAGARQPGVSRSPSSAVAGAGSCAIGHVSSHRDNGDMIQRDNAAGAPQPMTHPSLQITVPQPPHRIAPPYHFRSAMPSSVGDCGRRSGSDDGAAHNAQALVSLFRRMLDRFYLEAMLWIYSGVLLHPAGRRTRARLHWLGVVTGRGLNQATTNVLTGFVAGYRASRQSLYDDVEAALARGAGDAGRLAGLAVELGVVLNPRQMRRSFSAVVRDLVQRTASQTVLLANFNVGSSSVPQQNLYRYESNHHHSHHQYHHRRQHHPGTQYSDAQQVPSSTVRHHQTPHRYLFPPPPPPYPGFLLHFLSVLANPPVLQQSVDTNPAVVGISENPSYEELLRLGDVIGEAKQRGLKPDVVQHLPSYQVPERRHDHFHAHQSVNVCVICLEEFTSGQMIRALPCYHEYHAMCVDRWLAINRTCPVCRYDIDPESVQLTTNV